MTQFRILLAIVFIGITLYTIVTISEHGWSLLPVFFGDMAKMEWPGQFNFDFMCFLILSGLWVSWRHNFSAAGILLGLVAVFGGALFLSAYLFIYSYKVNGDINALLLGSQRAV
ncbi:hypothetical protein [Oceanicoccus sp. KOV_DT_Chl]|uniref:hypothetical protein n=1 Tax=Oceanicoccus sp. KOV_DT_Chl TaxID=1904639 RepID=UPI000C799C6F|nr:hypothetical protein [Oceanicoccus sp. KOV_DT_Chl]